MNILSKLEKQKDTWFLIGTSFLFFLLRLPSLFEPLWYGDEGIYEVIGKAIRSGRLLYRDIWDNKPPLLYYIYALVNGDQYGAKLLSLIVGIATIIAFFFLAKKLLNSFKDSRISTFLFTLLFGLPLLEGNIANAENFMLLPIILSAILIVNLLNRNSKRPHPNPLLKGEGNYTLDAKRYTLVLAGLLLGLAFLIKIVALFDAAAFGVIVTLFILPKGKTDKKNFQLKKIIINLLSLYIGFIIPVFITVVYFWLNRALNDFIVSTFLSNIGYVGYANKLIIPQGFLILKLLLLATALFLIFYKRRSFSSSGIFIYIWLVFSLFNMFFSQRTYVHYSLVLLSSICLLTGYGITQLRPLAGNSRGIQKYIKYRHISVVILCAVIIFIHFNIGIGTLGKLIRYYNNYINFITKRISVDAYYQFFDPAAVRDEQLAQFINMHKMPHEKIFVWGNSGQLYMLTNTLPPGKYIVTYHMTFTNEAFDSTKLMLKNVNPEYIILLPHQPNIPYDLKNYSLVFSINGATIYKL